MSQTRRDFFLQSALVGGVAGLPTAALPQSGAPSKTPATAAGYGARVWTAKWISATGASSHDFGVYHFRRSFTLANKPDQFVVHVSGDNRYQLFVNGKRICWGPARGDVMHWRFETVDLAPHLRSGDNLVAAVVWNFGKEAPEAQQTVETGFVLQGDTKAEQVIDTNKQWKAARNSAYRPIPISFGDVRGYYVAGPGEDVDGSQYLWGWETTGFDDARWQNSVVVADAAGRDASDPHSRWMLVPRPIPMMEESPIRLQSVRRAQGIKPPASWPAQSAPFTVPPNTKATFLLDQTYLTTAYPEMVVSGGKEATVKVRYAECLQVNNGRAKTNRNQVDGLDFIGYHDIFRPSGGAKQQFRPLWWRTWRYVQLEIETKADPLTIEDLSATYTGYPFAPKATLRANGAELDQLIEVGFRTARLCAHETYMDCPYYEQLQYVGDTRIQALISLFYTGDARLVKNAIELINDSRNANACTMSRYPTRLQQYIPGFSLWWIGMVHDYSRYVDDPQLVKRMITGVRSVLSFFESYQRADGTLGHLPWWRYMDWADQWPRGDAPEDANGSSAPFDFLYIMALDWAADLETQQGTSAFASLYRDRATKLRSLTRAMYWDATKRLFSDTPEKAKFSQQGNILAVLAGVAGPDTRELTVRVMDNREIVQASLYFKHYLFTALNRVGEGDRYLQQLADWRAMIANGLTTFSEVLDTPTRRSRSDCHAWSASPNYELFHTLLGVDSAAPGFAKVVVRPFMNGLPEISGSVPHPKGAVEVQLKQSGAKLQAQVSLPPGVTGQFIWNGQTRALASGRNVLEL